MNAPFHTPPQTPAPHRFTLDDVERMQEIGLLEEGGKFELIEGEIIDMPSEGKLHLELKERLNRFFDWSAFDSLWGRSGRYAEAL